MLKSYRTRRQFYYLLFAISFGLVWYLFKFGGMPKPLRALFSTAIDLSFSLAALIITVELLLPRLFYKQRYRLFTLFFTLVIAITGSLTIMSQLGLMGYSLSGYYEKNLAHFREHYYYWFLYSLARFFLLLSVAYLYCTK